MKQGCLFILAIILLVSFFYYQLIAYSKLSELWWLAVLFGTGAGLVTANLMGVIQFLRHLSASSKVQHQWKDGDLVVLSGRLTASGSPLTSPVSGKSSVIVEFEIQEHGFGDSQKSMPDFRGCLMTRCSIQGHSGQAALCGFPLLTQWHSEYYEDDAALSRIAQFMLSTPSTVMPKSPLAALSELNKILSDDDGEVLAFYRSADSPDFRDYARDSDSDSQQDEEISTTDITDTDSDQKLRQENAEQAGNEPVDQIIYYLKSHNYVLKEAAIENGSEVTVMGTYNSVKRQINIGSGLEKLAHGIYKGPASSVLGRNLGKSVVMTLIFLALFLAANYFLLKELGLEPEELINYLRRQALP